MLSDGLRFPMVSEAKNRELVRKILFENYEIYKDDFSSLRIDAKRPYGVAKFLKSLKIWLIKNMRKVILLSEKNSISSIGAGGHAASVENCILENELSISGLILKSINEETLLKNKYDVYAEETIHTSLDKKFAFLINGIGMLPNCNLRDDIWKRFVDKGFRFVGLSAKSFVFTNR